VTLERELPYQTALRVSYLGTHGSDLEQNYALKYLEAGFNMPLAPAWRRRPTAQTLDPLTWRRVNPKLESQGQNRSGYSNSHSAQVEVDADFRKAWPSSGFLHLYSFLDHNDAGGFLPAAIGINDIRSGAARPKSLTFLASQPHFQSAPPLRFISIPPRFRSHHTRYNAVVDLPFGRGRNSQAMLPELSIK